jgi:hypothetical protein
MFWMSTYQVYGKEVQKEVYVIIKKGVYLYPLLRGAIPHLSAESLKTVSLRADNCQLDKVLTVTSALVQALNESATAGGRPFLRARMAGAGTRPITFRPTATSVRWK